MLKVAAVGPRSPRRCGSEPALDVAGARPSGRRATRCGPARSRSLAEPGAAGGVVYRYDDTNPEGRTARLLADRAVQRAAGRADPVPATDALVREAGSRYIDFLVPGLVGLGIMSNAIWGLGFSIVDARRRKLTKRLVATPMSRTLLPAVVPGLADDDSGRRGRRSRSASACSRSACRSAAG